LILPVSAARLTRAILYCIQVRAGTGRPDKVCLGLVEPGQAKDELMDSKRPDP
jgi:hypothetical protein